MTLSVLLLLYERLIKTEHTFFSFSSQDKFNMDQVPVLLRIIVAEDDIWKISLNKKPDSLEELVVRLKDLLSLPYDFKLQYEDQDFHLLCNFTDIADLPEKATLKIIQQVTLSLTILPSHTTRSDNEGSPADTDGSMADTGILSTAGSPPSERRQP